MSVREVRGGPGGIDGSIYSTGHGKTGYFPDCQEWRKVDDWWIGTSKERLDPDTLQRDEVIDGHPVTLEDGNAWLVPVARVFPIGTCLPESLMLGPNGQVVKEILPCFAAFAKKAETVFEFFQGEKELLEDEAWEIAVEALAINYHVGRQEVSALRLLTTINVAKVLGAIVDMPTIKEAAKKKRGRTARRRQFERWQRGLISGYVPSHADLFWEVVTDGER